MLMVAPSGRAKETVPLFSPNSFSQVFIFSGRVAMEEAVEKANTWHFHMLLKN